MSIFNSFTDKMYNLFRVVQCSYRGQDKTGFTTRSNMLGKPFRDPSTFPLARGRILPPDMKSDYIIEPDRFDCFVGEKRKWVKFNEIFDVDVRCVNDFLVRVALNGDFDKSLPMYEEVAIDTETAGLNSNMWTTERPTWFPNTSAYWKIVSDHIEQNISSHANPGCEIDAKCIPVEVKAAFTQYFRIELKVKSINGDECQWYDICKILQSFGAMGRLNEFVFNPVIVFQVWLGVDEV